MEAIEEKEVKSFIYEGNDKMIDFKASETPECPEEFKAQLRLTSGEIIDAPPDWRQKIWEWWFWSRRHEIEYATIMNLVRRR